MKFNLTAHLLFLSLIAFSQKNTIEDINKYVQNIESNPELRLDEYDWNEITKSHIDHGAILKIWKKENKIVKIKEQFGTSYGRYSRLIYLKDNKQIKGIETEENFGFINDEIDYSNLTIQFKMEVYVIGFNEIIEEYEFELTKEGKRKMTEPYCDLNSVFAILNEIKDL